MYVQPLNEYYFERAFNLVDHVSTHFSLIEQTIKINKENWDEPNLTFQLSSSVDYMYNMQTCMPIM